MGHMRYGLQASLIGLLAMAYIIWRPVSSGLILYPALALIAALSLADVLLSSDSARRRIPRPMMAIALILAMTILIGAAVGTVHGAPGVGHQVAVWMGGLAIWGAWAWAIDLRTIRRLLTAIVAAAGVLSGVIVLYIAANTGYIPAVIPAGLLESQAAGFDGAGGGTAIRFYGLSSLVIAGPMAAAGAILPASRFLPSRRLMIVVAVLAVLAALLSGRRAITVVIVLTPVLVWLIHRIAVRRDAAKPLRIPVAAFLLAPFAFLAALWLSRTTAAAQAVEAIRDALLLVGLMPGEVSTLDRVRASQATELLDGWGQYPIWGAGLGAELSSGYTRSSERSWSFELQYHLALFNLGLVGVLLLLTAVVVAVVAVRRAAVARPDAVPLIVMTGVGAVSVLVANASNPYLQAVGHQWGVALLLGVVCAVLRGGSTIPEEAEPPLATVR